MSDRLNLGLVGAGFWGKNLARNFHQLNVLKLICDPSETVLSENREQYPDVTLTPSFPDALAQANLDAVAIATPAAMHFSIAREALLAGKHVFVEKPLALTVGEGEELVAIARQKNRVLFVGHILHYHPAIHTIRNMLAEGELGRLQYIYSNRLNLGKFRREENSLWSFAPHDISVILSLVNEEPTQVEAIGSNILHPSIADTSLMHLKFPCGVAAHIFVSWLNPFKEQKLVVTGDRKMVVFDDTLPRERKLTVYPHFIRWQGGLPVPEKKEGIPIDLSPAWEEPLLLECRAFLDAVEGKPCRTDGEEGVRVLRVLQKAQERLDFKPHAAHEGRGYFIHETSWMDEGCSVGDGTRIWHFSHILRGSRLGQGVNIGKYVEIGPNAVIGNNVKIQNHVSIFEGVTLEDNVFCGPSCVFTNVINPRSFISRRKEIKPTLVREGATIGANATILCGVTIGRYAFVGMGAVVTRDVQDHALVYGNPATQQGWMCECGNKLDKQNKCGHCGKERRLP